MANNSEPTRLTIGTKAEPVRFSYAYVHEPRAAEQGQEPKYSVTILIPKTYKEQLAKIEEAIEAAIEVGKQKHWSGKVPRFKYDVLRDGDEENPDKPEYEGMMFISAKAGEKFRPKIFNANLEEIIDPDDFYSGCWGRVSVNFYPYNRKDSKGVACGLGNLMKTKDDTAFTGSGRSAAADFGDDEDDDF